MTDKQTGAITNLRDTTTDLIKYLPLSPLRTDVIEVLKRLDNEVINAVPDDPDLSKVVMNHDVLNQIYDNRLLSAKILNEGLKE